MGGFGSLDRNNGYPEVNAPEMNANKVCIRTFDFDLFDAIKSAPDSEVPRAY